MTSVRTILASLEPVADGWRGHIPDSWLQGRTAYGGLSSAIALHAAQASEPDLPALRSAQIAFIGPLSDEITVRTERLRRGRNATFIQADVSSEAGLGLRATFVFMRAIESRIAFFGGEGTRLPAAGRRNRDLYGSFRRRLFTEFRARRSARRVGESGVAAMGAAARPRGSRSDDRIDDRSATACRPRCSNSSAVRHRSVR